MLTTLFVAVIGLGIIGMIFGFLLAYADRKFQVKVNPAAEKILEILPGANCGACGYAGCAEFADKVAEGVALGNECAPGGMDAAAAIGNITGKQLSVERKTARILCSGHDLNAAGAFNYTGMADCRVVATLGSGNRVCTHGCLMEGTCVDVCPFGAISREPGRVPRVDSEKCTACGICVRECPRDIIVLVPAQRQIVYRCSSTDKGAVTKKACTVGCIGCKKCENICPFEAVHVENFLAVHSPEKCTDCGLCLDVCPTHAIEDLRRVHQKAVS